MFNRNFTIIIHWILDNIIPGFFRDCKWFMWPIIYLTYKDSTKYVMEFKENYPNLTDEEINHYYELIKDAPVNKWRKSDLNDACLDYIVNNIIGKTVLDASCGRGYLAKCIAEKNYKVTGCDIAIQNAYNETKNLKFQSGNIIDIPFKDNSFDTVICTHTLEHIREYKKAISELYRVAKKQVIIIIPCQREYKYTPDLHVNFCPYLYSFKSFIGIKEPIAKYFKLKGDFVCVINK